MLFFIVCASISLTLAAPENKIYFLEEGRELFETFINEHNKLYEGKEKEERLQIFLDNLKEINSLNEKSSNAVFGINKFSDLTKDEFIQTYTGFKVDKNLLNRKNSDHVFELFNYTSPNELDWRSKGVVSRVKNQATCGSDWAFSATGNVESLNAIKTGNMVEISEQQIVDCDNESEACCGGHPVLAINYLVKKGAMSEQSYPYKDADGYCDYNSNNVVVHVKDSKHFEIKEPQIQEKLYNTGPLSIVVDATVLKFYTKGVITDKCPSDPKHALYHAVLLVGYGQGEAVQSLM